MPTERIKRLKANHVPKHFLSEEFSKPVYLSILRSCYFTESWKKTEGKPMSIRKAEAVANYLDNVPIFIRPDELIVGYHSEDPYALPVSLETFSVTVIEDYIKRGLVKKEEIDEWRQYLGYWKMHAKRKNGFKTILHQFLNTLARAWKIEKGSIAYAVKGAKLAGTIFGVLKSVSALGNNIRKIGRLVAPWVRVENVKVIGR